MQRDAAHVPFVDTGSYPLRAGNAVRPLVDGEPAFRRICEAVEAARRSVWVTVAFVDPGFEMPGGRGSLFDVLDRAHARGLDVRVLFWRHRDLARFRPESHFAGTEADLRFLRERGTRWHARWDQAHGTYCQHQKSWLVDAGEPGEVAFVGGINLGRNSVVPPGHPPTPIGNTHDVYVELRGPSASDVHHNFVQRWNEASDRGEPDGCWPDARSQSQLAFPAAVSPPAGDVPVQIQRTVRRERYRDGTPAPGAARFDVAGGEFSVVDQYRRAIEAARSTIYLERREADDPASRPHPLVASRADCCSRSLWPRRPERRPSTSSPTPSTSTGPPVSTTRPTPWNGRATSGSTDPVRDSSICRTGIPATTAGTPCTSSPAAPA